MTPTDPALIAEYVSNEQALRDILQWLGYLLIEGDFTRSDGSRTRIAVRTPERLIDGSMEGRTDG